MLLAPRTTRLTEMTRLAAPNAEAPMTADGYVPGAPGVSSPTRGPLAAPGPVARHGRGYVGPSMGSPFEVDAATAEEMRTVLMFRDHPQRRCCLWANPNRAPNGGIFPSSLSGTVLRCAVTSAAAFAVGAVLALAPALVCHSGDCVTAELILAISGVNCIPCWIWSEVPLVCCTNFESTEFQLSTAYLASYGRQFKDPCDLRTCICNPETQRVVPMRDFTSIVKETVSFTSCCSRNVIKLFSSVNSHGSWAWGSAGENVVTIHVLPADADKVYLTLLPLIYAAGKVGQRRV
jgi:hypothetical protein